MFVYGNNCSVLDPLHHLEEKKVVIHQTMTKNVINIFVSSLKAKILSKSIGNEIDIAFIYL